MKCRSKPLTKRQRYLKNYNKTHRNEFNKWRYKQRRTLLGRYQTLKENAARNNRGIRWGRRRKIFVELSFEEYKEIVKLGRCSYCGGKLPMVGHGLDRVNNSLGYTKDNVKPCCKICNLAKGSMMHSIFVRWLNRVASYRRKN